MSEYKKSTVRSDYPTSQQSHHLPEMASQDTNTLTTPNEPRDRHIAVQTNDHHQGNYQKSNMLAFHSSRRAADEVLLCSSDHSKYEPDPTRSRRSSSDSYDTAVDNRSPSPSTSSVSTSMIPLVANEALAKDGDNGQMIHLHRFSRGKKSRRDGNPSTKSKLFFQKLIHKFKERRERKRTERALKQRLGKVKVVRWNPTCREKL